MKDAKICGDGQKPKDGKCNVGKVVPIFWSDFEFDTGGKKVSVGKIAKGLAKEMNRQYIDYSAETIGTKMKGRLISTRKGERLTPAQKEAAKGLL